MNQDNIVVVIPSVETVFQSKSVKYVWRSKKRKKNCVMLFNIKYIEYQQTVPLIEESNLSLFYIVSSRTVRAK